MSQPDDDGDALDELDRAFTGAATTGEALLQLTRQPAPAPAVSDGVFVPCFGSLEAWVVEVFTATYLRRPTPTFRWCAQWWRHPEAIARLEALWRSWEALRLDPMLGIANWYASHLDQQLPILTGPAGPFADCEPTEHFDPPQPRLPHSPAPAGWWPPPTRTD